MLQKKQFKVIIFCPPNYFQKETEFLKLKKNTLNHKNANHHCLTGFQQNYYSRRGANFDMWRQNITTRKTLYNIKSFWQQKVIHRLKTYLLKNCTNSSIQIRTAVTQLKKIHKSRILHHGQVQLNTDVGGKKNTKQIFFPTHL